MIKSTENCEPLPDSELWRDWCRECGEPMRISKSQLGHPNICLGCGPHTPHDRSENLTPRQRESLMRQIEE
jgi:hypothetical protein